MRVLLLVATLGCGDNLNDEQPAAPIGTGGPGSCSGTGRGALLQTNGTSLVKGTFIRDVANPDGSRDTNYTGPLVDALRETLSLGASGCAFAQPLRAAELALT